MFFFRSRIYGRLVMVADSYPDVVFLKSCLSCARRLLDPSRI